MVRCWRNFPMCFFFVSINRPLVSPFSFINKITNRLWTFEHGLLAVLLHISLLFLRLIDFLSKDNTSAVHRRKHLLAIQGLHMVSTLLPAAACKGKLNRYHCKTNARFHVQYNTLQNHLHSEPAYINYFSDFLRNIMKKKKSNKKINKN